MINSYKIDTWTKIGDIELNTPNFTKNRYLWFNSETKSKSFLRRQARQQIAKTENYPKWHIAIISVYEYQSGLYEPFLVISNPFKIKNIP